MWGLGLEHEVHMGFDKKIVPNLFMLKEYLDAVSDTKSNALLKSLRKHYTLEDIENSKENLSDFEKENVNRVFKIKFANLTSTNIKTVHYFLQEVTIIVPSYNLQTIVGIVNKNILNHYIENRDKLRNSSIKIFKGYNNNIQITDNVKRYLMKRKLYNEKKNSSIVDMDIHFKGRKRVLKYYGNSKFKSSEENTFYKNYIINNYYRFLNSYMTVNVDTSEMDLNLSIYTLLSRMKSQNFVNTIIDLDDLTKKKVNEAIVFFKNNYKNSVREIMRDMSNDKKEMFPSFRKCNVRMNVNLYQNKTLSNTISHTVNHQNMFFDKLNFKLMSKAEIYDEIDHLLDIYIILSNKNVNFINLEVDDMLTKQYTYKLDYPIKYLINMAFNEAITTDPTKSGPLFESKNLTYKNVTIEQVTHEVSIYQKIVKDVLNKTYSTTDFAVYGSINEMIRGGDINIISLYDGVLEDIIYTKDYFGSYHLWLTMPSKSLSKFVDETTKLAKLLQWVEPMFFSFYTNNIHNGEGSFRYRFNPNSGYGTSDPDLFKKKITKFEYVRYIDGRDMDNLDLDHIKYADDMCVYDNNGKKIINYEMLGERNITSDEILKRLSCNKKQIKTYLDILWEESKIPDMRLGADIRSPYWKNNFIPKLKKNWEPINIMKKDRRIYRYYFNRETKKITQTPPYSKSKTKDRTGFEFRVFDNMDIKHMQNIMNFSILIYIAIINKRKNNITKALLSSSWNRTLANCLMKGVNQFKLSNAYTKRICEMLEIKQKNFGNIVNLFQYCADELHNKYKNNSIYKKMVKNHQKRIIIENVNLYHYRYNINKKRGD